MTKTQTGSTHASSEVRVHYDRESGGNVVDLEIEPHRVGLLIAAIAAAARSVRAVIQRLELRPRRATLGARIVLAADSPGELSAPDRSALITVILAAIQSVLYPAQQSA